MNQNTNKQIYFFNKEDLNRLEILNKKIALLLNVLPFVFSALVLIYVLK
jgi:hypothetical protein